MNPILLLVALVAGWMVQMYFTYQQSTAFNRQVRALRGSGTVSVGVGGRRYRGGRAFVALALDDQRVEPPDPGRHGAARADPPAAGGSRPRGRPRQDSRPRVSTRTRHDRPGGGMTPAPTT
jgi:DNA-binding transcriptional regulator of glucitol operon